MDTSLELTSAAELRAFYARFSMIRLGIVVFMLVLAMAEILGLTDRGMRFEPFRDQLYILFFVFGFTFSIGYLVAAARFVGSMAFFQMQLTLDLILTTWWVLLTGVSFSGFLFLYVLCLFFYGRIAGMKTIIIASVLSLGAVFTLSCVQFYYPLYWGSEHVRGSDIAYNFSLLFCALVLVNILVRVSTTEEGRLVHRVMEQDNALRRAEALQYRVFDWIDAGLIVLDDGGRITSINHKALEYLDGMDRNLIFGRALELFFPEFAHFWENRGNQAIRRGTVNGARQRILGFKMTELPERQGWMILFSDITDVQRMETQIKEMEKLASVGELAAGLAHEMKNPLAGIKTSLQLLLDGDLTPEFSERLSRVIVRDIDRLDSLLKDFLIFARPQAPSGVPLDLHSEIEDVLMPLRLQYPRVGIRIEVGSDPYYFDRNQLHQILINLLVNALQALEGVSEAEIVISETVENGQRIVAVTDNGPGLSTAMDGKCFDPFVTTKPVGSGLGLAIARRLAAQNKTFVDLYSMPGAGARAVLVQEYTPPVDPCSTQEPT